MNKSPSRQRFALRNEKLLYIPITTVERLDVMLLGQLLRNFRLKFTDRVGVYFPYLMQIATQFGLEDTHEQGSREESRRQNSIE